MDEIANKQQRLSTVKYKVEVLETLKKIVEVELPIGSDNVARQKVMDMYYNDEIILSADDYFETEFCFLGRTEYNKQPKLKK